MSDSALLRYKRVISRSGRLYDDKGREETLLEVAEYAREVMSYLEKYGSSIVPHLLDTDENPGERLRDALRKLDNLA